MADVSTGTRRYLLDRVDDAAVVQLYADGFERLGLPDKVLIWHLSQAAIAGRDIYYDQRHRHGLAMRDVLEAIVLHPHGVPDAVLAEVRRYATLFWINSGPYNNLTARKFVLRLTAGELCAAVARAVASGAVLPGVAPEAVDAHVQTLLPMFLDASVEPMVTNKNPGPGGDILRDSANNLYAGLESSDLAGVRERYPLNSRLVKHADGTVEEEPYRVGGRYGERLTEVVRHLDAAIPLATPKFAEALRALMRWYRTGEEADRERFDIAWVQADDSPVDTMNGFIEVYMDARGVKGAWAGVVYYVHPEKTAKVQRLAADAQWFEDHMPFDPAYRKPVVQGVTATAIEVVIETGDSGPVTPIGVNLPNDQRIREEYGSKSVSLANVLESYEHSTPAAFRREFAWDEAECERATRWGPAASELTTEIHEVLGHGSGRMAAHVSEPPHALLREHYSALEEARADLIALYFVAEPRLAAIGVVDADEQPFIVQAEYEAYTRGALVQLRRVREGDQLEEDHMRNRQAIVHWLMAHTRAIDVRRREGRTYYVLVDQVAFRDGVARLLHEVQRIKSEGDYEAGRLLMETYGVRVDPSRRDEVVGRVDRLQMPSYTGFVMPELTPRYGADGTIEDVAISYPCDLTAQMLRYSAYRRAG